MKNPTISSLTRTGEGVAATHTRRLSDSDMAKRSESDGDSAAAVGWREERALVSKSRRREFLGFRFRGEREKGAFRFGPFGGSSLTYP